MSHRAFRAAGMVAAAFIACVGSAAVQAQTPPAATQGASGLKVTILQRFDVPGSNYETITALVEIAPNGVFSKHTHFGFDSGVLESGDVFVSVEGKPEQAMKPGDSWTVPPNTVHWGKAGPGGARIANTYVVEKGMPLATAVQ